MIAAAAGKYIYLVSTPDALNTSVGRNYFRAMQLSDFFGSVIISGAFALREEERFCLQCCNKYATCVVLSAKHREKADELLLSTERAKVGLPPPQRPGMQ